MMKKYLDKVLLGLAVVAGVASIMCYNIAESREMDRVISERNARISAELKEANENQWDEIESLITLGLEEGYIELTK